MYETSVNSLLLLGVLWPLMLVPLLSLKKIRPITLSLAAWAGIPALFAALLVSPSIAHWNFPWLLLGMKIGLDATGTLFLLGSALLWSVAGIYTKAYFSKEDRQISFYSFFLLAMAGNFGLVISQDIFSFYLFFTLMSFASYGLVVFNKDKEAFDAGLVYIILVVIGEVMLFVAFLLLAQTSDVTSFESVRTGFINNPNKNLVILLLFTAFGIKAGIIGLHVWLPLAHPVAPTPASAVLSGAMINAGLLGWLRFLPLGEIISLYWAAGIILLGLLAQFYGVIIGLTQRNPKTLLAYSSISQMGIMTMLIGFGFYLPEHWKSILSGITFFALHHGLSKGALFLGVGMLGSTNKLQRYAIWLGLCIPALALAAVPYSSGMTAKFLLKSYTAYFAAPWSSMLSVLLVIGTVNTTLLMIRLLYLVRPAAAPFGVSTSFSLLWPWILLLASILSLPFSLDFSVEIMRELNALPFLYPLLLSIFITVFIRKIKKFQNIKPVPAGDIVLYYEKVLLFLIRNGKKFYFILLYYTRFLSFLTAKITKFSDKIAAWIK
ncbi:proton-conducting transporter membrane subunit [Sulfurimonas sp. NWX367]|uniref:complex I subunit 5 family protein n=1 Tax=Sulfurimonas sp. NWX367 TaxID=2925413 RepID=UPI003204CAA6